MRAGPYCLLSLFTAVAACGSDPPPPVSGDTLQLCPSVVYTGFVPVSTMEPDGLQFSVRVLAVEGSGLTWGTGNKTVATARGDDEIGVITAIGEGVTRVSATAADGRVGNISVSVKQYPADSHLLGSMLYDQNPCSGCHDSPGQSNVTSSGVSDNTDEEVLAAVTMGIKPEGGMLNVAGHMFPMEGDNAVNIVAYMRSIMTRRPPGMDACR